MPDLFDATQPTNFKAKLRSTVERLAASNILIGTSSWKYDGWLGTLYDQQRYCYRGKFAESRFERDCLAEYAETLKTVCVDAAYYQFPSAKYLDGLVSKVPADFCKRRLLLTNHDLGVEIHTRMLQPDLNFAVSAPELFAGPEMGEDALRVLGEYLKLHERIAAEVQAGRPRLRDALEWSKRVKSGQ